MKGDFFLYKGYKVFEGDREWVVTNEFDEVIERLPKSEFKSKDEVKSWIDEVY